MRGFRIELGSIESTACKEPRVEAAAAVVGTDREAASAAAKTLVCYVTARDAARPPAVEAVKQTILKHLPDYMLPNYIVVLGLHAHDAQWQG